jgi:DNA polymerase delta subunit 1
MDPNYADDGSYPSSDDGEDDEEENVDEGGALDGECDERASKFGRITQQPLPPRTSKTNYDYRMDFVKYSRPVSTVQGGKITFMLVDAESVIAQIRNDMDDYNVEHSFPQQDLMEGVTMRRVVTKRPREVKIFGPIVKLYGVCEDGTSTCLDVYGHYPAFRLQVTRGTPSRQCMERIRNYMEETLSRGGATPNICNTRTRNVVSGNMLRAFSAFPYTPHPSTFYEYRLSKPYHVRQLSEHFVKIPIMQDDRSEGGILGIIPHSGEDSLTQYMVDTGISGFGWVSVVEVEDSCDEERFDAESCTCNFVGDCKKSSAIANQDDVDSIAPLRVMAIDIECIKDEGMPTPERNPVIIIGVIVCVAIGGVVDASTVKNLIFTWSPPNSGGVSTINGAHYVASAIDETEMFVAFGAFLSTYDPDIYVGHNIIGFDIPYIVTRASVLGVQEVMFMGRRRERKWMAPREIVKVRKNGDTRKTLRADTPGRIQLDTLPFIQNLKKESSYRLGALAQKYLGEGKDDVGYQMIGPMWRQSPETRARLCMYCLKDSQLSLGLAMCKDFEMILSVIELSRGTRVRASQLLRSGNQEKVKTLVLNEAKTPHFDSENLPVFFPYETPKPRSKDDKFQGATVINPKRGARDKNHPVAVGDFSSLYPSIMLAHNLCYSTMINVGRNADAPKDCPPHDTSPDIGTHFVRKEVRQGLLPRILESLLSKRNHAKAMMKSDPDPAHKRMYDSRQLQLKIIANSVYGVLSASGGWFVRMEIGESVTAWGRSMIMQAMNIAKSVPFNADVIYGDTDSIMMVFPDCATVPDAFERLKRVCDDVTASFPKPVAMAAEKVYEGHLQLGKKRYAGWCHIPPAKPKMDSKGVEKNRLDNCFLVRDMMAKVFDLLLVEQNTKAALDYVHSRVDDLIHRKIDFSDLVITKSISKSDYKGKVVHVEVAKRMKARDSSYLMAPGERIPYVIVNSSAGICKNAKVCDKAEDPLWAIQHGMEIDVSHYIKDISRPLSRVLMWYIAPKDMLEEIASVERAIAEATELKDDNGKVEILEKSLKKLLEKMTDKVACQIFGQGALSDIPRPAPKRSGPISKFLTKRVNVDGAADVEKLKLAREKLVIARAKCAKCKGRDDDINAEGNCVVSCVQRDCGNLFTLAMSIRDVEELIKK